MKKRHILLPMVAICVSCAKEPAPEQESATTGVREFIANIESVQTKTVLDADLSVKWGAGDAISVFDEAGNHFQFKSQGEGTSVVFRQVTEGELVGSTFYAIFPYNENNTISGNVISTFMNTNNYSASPGSFSKTWHNVMTAKSSGNELDFKNLAALVKFEVPQDLSLASFYFSATNVVAREIDVAIDDSGIPSVSSRSTESYGCTVLPPEGSATLAAGVYYMPILPGTYRNFRLALTWASGTVTQSDAFSLDEFVADRNKVINVGTLYDNRDYYKWISFENGMLHSSVANNQENAILKVIENPWKYTANSSRYILESDASARTSNIHGGFTVDISGLNSAVRGRIRSVKFQMFMPSANAGKYYPRLELDDNSRIMPVSINGTKPAGTAWTQAEFNEAIIADGWNTFVYTYDDANMSLIRFRPMAWFSSGGNVDASTGNHLVYFDNIGFSFMEE